MKFSAAKYSPHNPAPPPPLYPLVVRCIPNTRGCSTTPAWVLAHGLSLGSSPSGGSSQNGRRPCDCLCECTSSRGRASAPLNSRRLQLEHGLVSVLSLVHPVCRSRSSRARPVPVVVVDTCPSSRRANNALSTQHLRALYGALLTGRFEMWRAPGVTAEGIGHRRSHGEAIFWCCLGSFCNHCIPLPGLFLTTRHHWGVGGGHTNPPLTPKDWPKFSSVPSANQNFLWRLWHLQECSTNWGGGGVDPPPPPKKEPCPPHPFFPPWGYGGGLA